MRIFPFTVNDTERDVLVWGASSEVQEDSFFVIRVLDNLVGRGFSLINEIGVENVELRNVT